MKASYLPCRTIVKKRIKTCYDRTLKRCAENYATIRGGGVPAKDNRKLFECMVLEWM